MEIRDDFKMDKIKVTDSRDMNNESIMTMSKQGPTQNSFLRPTEQMKSEIDTLNEFAMQSKKERFKTIKDHVNIPNLKF